MSLSKIATLALAAISLAAIPPDHPRDVFDPPPPTVIRSATGRPEVALYSTSLEDYEVAQVTHRRLNAFARETAAQIALLARHHKSLLVIITGTADGIPNQGVTISLSEFPLPCRRAVAGRIDDRELALLRGCIARELLLSSYPHDSPPAVLFDTRIDDEPDGGAIGGRHRAVLVEVHLR